MMIYWNLIIVHLFILIIWFKTDAFIEYSKLFGIQKWFFIDDFEKKRTEDFELTYQLYLRQHRNCFLIRLITCPICLTTWLTLPTMFNDTPISSFSLNVILTLALYYLFSKLMR